MKAPESLAQIIENKHFQDFNPIVFGRDQCLPNQSVSVPFSEFNMIHYVISGKGRLRLNDTWYSVSPQQIFIVPVNVDNFFQADQNDPWDYIWIGFTGQLANQFTQLPPVLDFPSNIFFDMLEVDRLDTMKEEFLAEKLFTLYRFLFSKHMPNNYSAATKNFIKANYMNSSISIEQIAQNLNLNRRYLSKLFKQEYKCSIQEYLIRTRVTQALNFLNMGYTVQQTALHVGYTDASNFSKVFKKYVGISPQKYQHQKEVEQSPTDKQNTLQTT